MRFVRNLICLCFFTFAFLLTSSTQVAITGRITGTVTDGTGAAIEGATITVTGPALMEPRVVTSQSGGAFLAEQLPPGQYEVNCSKTGFNAFLQKGIVLTAGFTATVNATLPVGNTTQTVEVMGKEPVVDVQSSSTPTTFEISMLQNVPSGRDPWSTVAQVPGTTTSTFDVAGNQSAQQSSMSVHGSKTTEAVYSFNGLNLDWPGGNGGSTAFYVDYDSFQEIQVVTDAAPPEVSVGGVYINMVTKSGSNLFHGLAGFYYLTNGTQATLQPTTFTSPTTGVTSVVKNAGSPLIMARDITLNGGGPLIKDKLWGFGAYRFYVVKDAQLASLNSNGLPGTDPNHQSNGTIRLDNQATVKNHFDGIWLYNVQNRFYRRNTSYTYVDQQAAGRQVEPAWAGEAQWTATITPSFLVDTRAGYMHLHEDQQNEPGVTPSTFSVADGTLSTLKGVQQTYPLSRSGLTRLASAASWFKGGWAGSHNFKGGGEWAIASTNANTNAPQGINVFFNNGTPYQVRVYNTPIVSQSLFHTYALFVQDAWTIDRRLTLNIGTRFEHFRTFNPKQCSPTATFSTLFTTRCFAQSRDLADFNNVVPRISAAWDPTGKGRQVIRAGFNMFEISQGTSLASTVNPNTASGNIYNWTDTNGDGIPQQSEYINTPATPATFGGINTTIDPNISRPYAMQVNAGYERQIFKDMSVGAGYYFRTTHNQIARINTAVPPSYYTSTTTIANPLLPKYPNVQAPAMLTLYSLDPSYKKLAAAYELTNVSAADNNRYDGVEVTATRRFDNHWQLLGGFTWQRNHGTYSATTSDDFNDPNQNLNRYDSSIDQDAPYLVRLDGTYVAPWKITASLNFQHETGYPFLPTYVVPANVGLTQSETIKLAPNGAMRLDSVNDMNLRLARPTSFHDGRMMLEPVVDLNNLTNANPVIARTASWGTNFFRQSNFLNPFVARFGMKLTW
jgi:Carboxypeptidase regulatory-like domain/TonB dependent receptor-like, beta-barrel